MAQTEYTYRALRPLSDEIRLLRITPDHEGLELQTFKLASAPEYIALSYTWGPAEDGNEQKKTVRNTTAPKHRLTITTESGASYYLEVLDNLYQGLEEIRRRQRETRPDDLACYVWADAICINQRDTDEVNQQVNMMDRIYSRASKVLVWLGTDSRAEMPRVSKALKAMVKMRRIITDERMTPGSSWRENTGIPDDDLHDLLAVVGLPGLDSEEWSVILGLFNRAWFRRLWVVQEIALAKRIEVWCGGVSFTWRCIEQVTELLKWDLEARIVAADRSLSPSRAGGGVGFYSLPSRSAGILTSIRKWAVTSRVPNSLFGTYKLISGREEYHPSFAYAVLGALFPHEATDARDKVFGALGLVRKLAGSQDIITSPLGDADYSLTAGEVYTAATKEIISGTGWLGMLSLVKVPKERRDKFAPQDLPSWVPTLTWTSTPTLSLRGDHNFNAAGRFKADLTTQLTDSLPSIQFRNTHGIELIGFPARRIAAVYRKSEPLREFMSQQSTFEAGVNLLLDHTRSQNQGTYPTTGELVIDAFWKTMMAGRRRFTRKSKNNTPGTDVRSAEREQFFKFWLYSHFLLALIEWGNTDERVKRAPVLDVKEFGLVVPDKLGYMERLASAMNTQASFKMPGHKELLAVILDSKQPRDYYGWLEFARGRMTPFVSPAGEGVGNRVMFSTRSPETGSSNEEQVAQKKESGASLADNEVSYLGLGHEEMREGDEVWISPRGPVPLLLRPLRDEAGELRRGYYSLLGECYLHGAMYGEVLHGFEKGHESLWEMIWLE